MSKKMIGYLQMLLLIEKFCEEFKSEIIRFQFTDTKSHKKLLKPSLAEYCWVPRYQELWQILRDIVDICDMLGVADLERQRPILLERVIYLSRPEMISTREHFEAHLDHIKNTFKHAQKEIVDKLQLLTGEEADRLNEALNCHLIGCNYASVAMSVSTIEFRLLNLMQSVKPNPELEQYTLGKLIDEYLKNKRAYKNIIPKKHEPLLNLCNTYRIFSVHPKKEEITRAIATSIINMTFTFLLDKEMKQKAETK